jgi:hypothetical protein
MRPLQQGRPSVVSKLLKSRFAIIETYAAIFGDLRVTAEIGLKADLLPFRRDYSCCSISVNDHGFNY